jgi:hypothetical protein
VLPIVHIAENGEVLSKTRGPVSVVDNLKMSAADEYEELATASVMLMHQVRLGDQDTSWRMDPQHVSSSDTVSSSTIVLTLRPLDDDYILRITTPTQSVTDIEINDVLQYVTKTDFWHEVTMLDGRQMALCLSGTGLARFCNIIASTLRHLGKYDRLKSSRDFFNAADLVNQQKIIMMRSFSLQELQKKHHQPQQSLHQLREHQLPHNALKSKHTSNEHLYEILIPTGLSSTDASRERTTNVKKRLPSLPAPRLEPSVDHQLCHPLPQSGGRQDQRVSTISTNKPTWNCPRCTLENHYDSSECAACPFNRQLNWLCPARNRCRRGVNPSHQLKCSSCYAWKCNCTTINFRSSVKCIKCQAPNNNNEAMY